MSCPTVIRVTTAQGPPGIGLPAGTADAGKFVRKAGSAAYAYELVTPDAIGLPQSLAPTDSPTFAGLTLSGLAANGLLFTGTGGLLTRLPLGSGLSIVGGQLTANGTGATDLSYDPATRLLASSTGADVTLPLFSPTTAGLVGASGGGTTTFLRADGTWAAPSGGGATDLSYDPATRTVASSTGADAVLTLADGINAGLMSSADYLKLLSLTFGVLPVPVRNNSGAEIAKGVPVYVTGSSGTRITIAPADASLEATAARTLGLTSAAIPHNSDGTVIAVGPLEGLNTSTLTEGQIIWLSETTGGMTTTRPTQPAHGVVLGYCVKQGAGTSGIVYAKVDNGLELDELHDILITGKATGQALMVAADGLWKNRLLLAADLSDSSASGRTVLTGTPAQARTALQLGSAAQSATTDFATTAQGTKADSAVQPAGLSSALASKADLVGGVIPSSQIPAIAITVYLGAVSSQSAMLALVGQQGDWCLRTDSANAGLWILSGEPSSLLANWVQIPVPTVPVQSVNGQVGVVILGAADVGAATAAQGALAATAVQPSDARLTDAREWSAATIDQAEAEAGTGTTRRAFTAQRVFQAVAAWWSAYSSTVGRALATAVDAAAGRTAIGAAASGAIGSSGLTMATARLLGRTTTGTGAPEEINVVGATLVGGVLTITSGTASPGGTSGQAQFNNAGALGGAAGLTIDASGNIDVGVVSGRLRLPPANASPQQSDVYVSSGVLYYRDASNTEQRPLIASGNLASIANPATAFYNLFHGTNKVPMIFNIGIGFFNGAAASADPTSATGGIGVPHHGVYSTGTTSAGFAGLSVQGNATAVTFNGNRNSYPLQQFNSFRTSFLFRIPTLSDGTDSFRVYFGMYRDAGTFLNRASAGMMINGSTVTACATAAGTETVSATTDTYTPNTWAMASIEWTGTAINVRLNNGPTLTVNSGFPLESSPMFIGGFIVKTAGANARTLNIVQGFNFTGYSALP